MQDTEKNQFDMPEYEREGALPWDAFRPFPLATVLTDLGRRFGVALSLEDFPAMSAS